MTTTHTFHGLSTDSRPSSRVLNPPGGSSSNIFGCESQMKQHSYVRSSLENVSREKHDTAGQGVPAATASPQQKSWAPRSAFNPITGEPYGQQKPKPEPHPPVAQTPSVTNASNSCDGEAVQLSAESTTTSVGNNIQPELIETAAPAEKPQPTTAQSGRLFGGGAEEVKEHRSTRVSQPPGGRSSKLW